MTIKTKQKLKARARRRAAHRLNRRQLRAFRNGSPKAAVS